MAAKKAKKVDPDRFEGAYEKFKVKRTDNSHRKGKKHEFCEYFVLDLHHDAFAKPALKAYIKACRKKYPQLAIDLKNVVSRMPVGVGRLGPERLYRF